MLYRYTFLLALIFLQFNLHAQNKPIAKQKGKASYYADTFEGRKTANGEIFRQNKFTAAHKSLPFGTWVKVVNLDNKKAVIVRINDRGPFVKGRIIDLSKAAAKEIGNTNKGVFSVFVQVYRKDTNLIQTKALQKTISLIHKPAD